MDTNAPMNAFQAPAPYRIVRNFLGDELIERLLAHALASREDFAPTRVGGKTGREDREIRISLVLRKLGPLKDELKARFRAIADWSVAEFRLSPFDLDSMEIELVAHGDGAFYARHIDTATGDPELTSDRVLTGVLYFHALPRRFGGGELRMHSILPPEQGGRHEDIEMERDMLLLFPSWAPHEVRPVSCPSGDFADHRFAINCWYRKRRAA